MAVLQYHIQKSRIQFRAIPTPITDPDSNWLLRWISATLKVSTLVFRTGQLRPQNWINWTDSGISPTNSINLAFSPSLSLSFECSKCGSTMHMVPSVVHQGCPMILDFYSRLPGQDFQPPNKHSAPRVQISIFCLTKCEHVRTKLPFALLAGGFWFLEVEHSVYLVPWLGRFCASSTLQ